MEYAYDYTRGLEDREIDELAKIESGNIEVFAEVLNDTSEDLLSTPEGRNKLAQGAHERTTIDIARAEILIEKLSLQIRKRASEIVKEPVKQVAA